jgi:hypothetical protein
MLNVHAIFYIPLLTYWMYILFHRSSPDPQLSDQLGEWFCTDPYSTWLWCPIHLHHNLLEWVFLQNLTNNGEYHECFRLSIFQHLRNICVFVSHKITFLSRQVRKHKFCVVILLGLQFSLLLYKTSSLHRSFRLFVFMTYCLLIKEQNQLLQYGYKWSTYFTFVHNLFFYIMTIVPKYRLNQRVRTKVFKNWFRYVQW